MNIVSREGGTLQNTVPLTDMPAITAFQKDEGKYLQENVFFIGEGKYLIFFSVIVVLFLLLKTFKICFGIWLFNLGRPGIHSIHQWLPL